LGKSIRGDKEYSRLQEALYENKRLKREIASIRKQLARLDLDRHDYVKNIIDEHYAREDQEETAEKMLRRLKEEWRCKNCQDGYLEINLYMRAGETYYFRKCNTCENRTKGQKYSPDRVQGPIKIPSK
jgi:hypothetical protein